MRLLSSYKHKSIQHKSLYKIDRIAILALIFLSSAFCLTLTGCATQSNLHHLSKDEEVAWKKTKQKLAKINTYVATGKTSFSKKGRGGNAAVTWRQEEEKYMIAINLPMGTGTLRITGGPNMVSLMKPDGTIAVAKTPEELIKNTLEWEIPVSGLQYWVKGLPSPESKPVRMMFNEQQQLGLLVQQGWTVRYESYMPSLGVLLPERMTLENGPVKIKLIFKNWETLAMDEEGIKPYRKEKNSEVEEKEKEKAQNDKSNDTLTEKEKELQKEKEENTPPA